MSASRIVVAAIAATLLTSLAACGEESAGLQDTDSDSDLAAPESVIGSAFSLPSPIDATATLSKLPAGESAILTRQGYEFEAQLGQRVSVAGFNACFDPYWQSSASTFDSAAYALYRFYLPGYSGAQSCRLVWAAPPGELSNLWIGFSNWNTGRWDWYSGMLDGSVDLGSSGLAQYVRGGTANDLLVGVLLLGMDQCYLQEVSIGGGAIAENWPLFGHDASRTRYTAVQGPDTPDLRWRFRASGAVVSSPACGTDGSIYVGSYDGFLYALNPDCTMRWQFDAGAPIRSSPQVLPNGSVYIGCDDGSLYAIAGDGTLEWAVATGGSVYSSPVIGYDGTVYCGSGDGSVSAVTQYGALVWTYATGGPVQSSAAIDSVGNVYIGSDDGNLYALTHEGALAWRFQTAGPVQSSPAIGADGTIYVGSQDGCVYAISPDGGELWQFASGSSFGVSSPALSADGLVYIGALDGYLYAIDADPAINSPELRLKWRCPIGTAVSSSPAVDGSGRVYIGGQDGYIYAIIANGGTGSSLLWRWNTFAPIASSPAINADGVLYVGSDAGALYSIGPLMQCPPHGVLTVNPHHPDMDEAVTLDGSASYDPDGGTITRFEWDWEGDGSWDFDSGQDATVEHVYTTWGVFNPTLRVSDDANGKGTVSIAVIVNSPPIPNIRAYTLDDPMSYGDGVAGMVPLMAVFDNSRSYDPDGTIVRCQVDFDDGNGWTEQSAQLEGFGYMFGIPGEFIVWMRLTDDDGATTDYGSGVLAWL